MKKFVLLSLIIIMLSAPLVFPFGVSASELTEEVKLEYKTEPSFAAYAGEGFEKGSMNELMYKKIKAFFEDVANGKATSAKLYLEGDDLPSGLSWTKQQLGVTLVENNAISEAANQKIADEINKRFDLAKVVLAVLSDCPYEQYWYDKSKGVSFIYGMTGNSNQLSISYFELTFNVIKTYQGADPTTLNKTKIASAKSGIESAKFIVSEFKNHSDFDKLKGYAEKICFHAAYDHDAVNNGMGYGDPWQIINVFDGLTDTNVVCEGYAKAFKYLCDLTDFDGEVKCYTVSGTMDGGTGAGAHMWNVVTYNGKNYLVDVTNCDKGTIGNGMKLFMRGVASSDGGKTYKVPVGSANITFSYDVSQKDLFVNGYLVLDTKDAEGCDHSNVKTISAKSSSCTEQGWKEYKKCEDCGVMYNQNGAVITEIPYIALASHTPTQVKDEKYLLSKGNCARPSLYFESCKKCKAALNETFEGEKSDHDVIEVWFVENGYHFYRCSVCSYKENYGKCSGGSATCTSQAKCDTCKMPYGDFAAHKFGSWKTDSVTHWKECSCYQRTDIGQHIDKNTDGKCDSCSYSMPVASEPPKDESKPPVNESKPPVDESKPPVDESKPPVNESKPPVDESKPVSESVPPTSLEASDGSIPDESIPDGSKAEQSETESVPPEVSVAESIDENENESEQIMPTESSSNTSVSRENIQDLNPKVIIVIAASILVPAGVVIFIIKKRK